MCPCQRCDRFLQPGQMRDDPDSLSHFCFFLHLLTGADPFLSILLRV